MNDNVRTQLSGHGLSEEHLEIHNHDLQKDESIEVSYSVLIVDEEQQYDDTTESMGSVELYLINLSLVRLYHVVGRRAGMSCCDWPG